MSTTENTDHPRPRAWAALVVGICGTLAALALPFAPVVVHQTTVTWPAPGTPVVSGTALFAPYRPATLDVSVPCAALRSDATAPVTVLTTGDADGALMLTAEPAGIALQAGAVRRVLAINGDPACRVDVRADANGMVIVDGDGTRSVLPGQPVPKVFGFWTDLDPDRAAGMSATAMVQTPFGTSPSGLKMIIVGFQWAAVLVALALLGSLRRRRPRPRSRPRLGHRPRTWWIDGGLVLTLAAWAVIGPLAVDDGWAATIARTVASSGDAGNYYRWWNASEVPFALSQQVLSRLTEVSLAPLWLRLPSLGLGVATWLVLSRGVLGAALGPRSATRRVRLLAAVLFLAAWLPFDLGTRPESYVAFGLTAVTAVLWRARSTAALGWAVLIAAMTLAVSPTGVVVVAPLAVFAARALALMRAEPRLDRCATAALLACVAAAGITAMFADQTWTALVTATEWHTFFGPTLPWYHEPDRYLYLLSGDQQGSAPKRLPVLLSAAMVPVVALLAWRRARPTRAERSAGRLGAIVVLAALALAVVPSKWSYHLGAVAGLFASFLTVSVVLAGMRVRRPAGRWTDVAAAGAGAVLLSGATALTFAGPNAWWQSTVYDLPWPTGPIRPLGLPLDHPLPWLGVGVVIALGYARWRRARLPGATLAVPMSITAIAAAAVLVLLVGSFVAAPLRRAAGSLAVANLGRLTGTRACGLADDIEVLPDGPVLVEAPDSPAPAPTGFQALSGYFPGAPPPDPPGTGASTWLWGSVGADHTASITTPWFLLPPLNPNDGVAVSVSGRTDNGNSLAFEFGAANGAVLGQSTPVDRVAVDESPAHPLWRSIGIDVAQIPPGSDRVRIVAVDARSDAAGWLAFTGPRVRAVQGLSEFLADNGPVLIAWPQAFLFPCVRNTVRVADGMAETPRSVIESPRPFFAEDRNQALGGVFAGIVMRGGLHEVPTRLVGHPDIDWGTLLTSPPSAVDDAVARSQTRAIRWGGNTGGQVPPER